MEQSIEKADKVLVLCDQKYCEKANAREGGVGIETAIITPDVYGSHDQEKFIPVIMEDFDYVPTYLKSRLGIDFREGHRDQGFEEILRTIFNKPLHVKPPLGKPPEWMSETDHGVVGNGYQVRKPKEKTSGKIKVCIRAWQEVINPETGRTHDEKGLKALDAVRYGPVHKVDRITSNLEQELLNEFKELYPDFRFDRFMIWTDEEKPLSQSLNLWRK